MGKKGFLYIHEGLRSAHGMCVGTFDVLEDPGLLSGSLMASLISASSEMRSWGYAMTSEQCNQVMKKGYVVICHIP